LAPFLRRTSDINHAKIWFSISPRFTILQRYCTDKWGDDNSAWSSSELIC
jgi:hypothetical protein